MKIAVVILNWNGVNLLKTFLPSVVNFSNKAEIYVVDNASTDNSIEFIEDNYPQVKTIRNKKNGGFSKGYNDALRDIDSDIYALVNSDVEATKDWLNPVLEEFKNNKNTAVIQPKILDYKDRKKFEYSGAAGGFLDMMGYPYCRGRIFNSLEEDKGQYEDTITISWASGACFFIRSNIFHRFNGFDEDYFAHQEEIDLCWKVNNMGYDIKYVGNSIVYHIGGATLKELNYHKTFLNFRNSLYSLVKNLPSDKVLYFIIIRIFLDMIACVYFVFKGGPIHAFAVLKSHFSFYKNLRKILSKRVPCQKNKKYYQEISIVWNYFILNIKKFRKK